MPLHTGRAHRCQAECSWCCNQIGFTRMDFTPQKRCNFAKARNLNTKSSGQNEPETLCELVNAFVLPPRSCALCSAKPAITLRHFTDNDCPQIILRIAYMQELGHKTQVWGTRTPGTRDHVFILRISHPGSAPGSNRINSKKGDVSLSSAKVWWLAERFWDFMKFQRVEHNDAW